MTRGRDSYTPEDTSGLRMTTPAATAANAADDRVQRVGSRGTALFPTLGSSGSGVSYVRAATLNRRARSAAQTQQTVGGTNTLLPVVYGTQRVGGRIFAIKLTTGGNLVVGVAWCHGEIDSFLSVQINDADVPRGVTVTNYTGTSSQTYDLTLYGSIAGYDDDLPNIAYSVFTIQPGKLSGFPRFNAKIKGKKIASSSGGAKAYSDNPAYIIADWIENTTYGMGRTVDWATVATVASACDALVGGEKKRILSLIIDTTAPGEEWLQTLRDYAGCWIVPDGSSFRLVADTTGSSVMSFTAANIVEGSLQLAKLKAGDQPTMIEVQYTDAGVTPYRDARYQTAAVTPRRLSRIAKPGITRYSQAVRYATERLNAATLCDLSAQFETFDEALKLQVGDLIDITHPIGLTAKVMRVTGIGPSSPGRWQIVCTEYDAAVYSSAVATAPTTPDTEVSDYHEFGAPTLVNLTETTGDPNSTHYYTTTGAGDSSLTTDAWNLGSVTSGTWTARYSVTDTSGTSVVSILLSTDGVTYTEHVANSVRARAQYAKVKIATSGSMVIAGQPRLRVVVETQSESGTVATAASGPTMVTLINSYAIINSVTATPFNTSALRTAVIDALEYSGSGGIASGYCLRFAGGSDYVGVADSASLDISNVAAGILVEALIKRRGSGGSSAETIVKKASNYILRLHTDGTLRGFIWTSGGTRYNIVSTYVVPTDAWVRISMRYIEGFGPEPQFYANGQPVNTSYTTSSQAQSLTGALTIGGDGSGTTESFNGAIDDVRIWAGDILPTSATTELAGTETGLRAYWKFNAGTGTSAVDSTVNGNTGTLYNSPRWRPYDGFDCYLFNSSGTQIAGDVSYAVMGY